MAQVPHHRSAPDHGPASGLTVLDTLARDFPEVPAPVASAILIAAFRYRVKTAALPDAFDRIRRAGITDPRVVPFEVLDWKRTAHHLLEDGGTTRDRTAFEVDRWREAAGL